jgi:hypothetical protein
MLSRVRVAGSGTGAGAAAAAKKPTPPLSRGEVPNTLVRTVTDVEPSSTAAFIRSVAPAPPSTALIVEPVLNVTRNSTAQRDEVWQELTSTRRNLKRGELCSRYAALVPLLKSV